MIALALAGCAGAPVAPGAEVYRFPPAFDVVQSVVVDLASDPDQTLLASLSRRPEGLEVSFFDPVFQTPLFRMTLRDGVVREERFVSAGPSAAQAKELLETLDRLYGAELRDGELSTFRYRFTAAEFRDFGTCRFPARIELLPRAGPVERITVRTLDADCEPGSTAEGPPTRDAATGR